MTRSSLFTIQRSGVSLAEVLISMGILTVGLLGAAAMFPVGGHYMQTGDIADRSGAIAQAALDDAIVRGHLDPENWVVLDIDGVSFTNPNGDGPSPNAMHLQSLREALRELPRNYANANTGQTFGLSEGLYRNIIYGSAFVIDPLGFASTLNTTDENGNPIRGVWQSLQQSDNDSRPLRRFPASADLAYNATRWNAHQLMGNSWPVRRVTTTINPEIFNLFARNNSYQLLQSPAAEVLFSSDDDHAVIFPESEDDPSRSRWETWRAGTNNGPYPATRQPRGDYSWLISVSPGSARARDALATQPDAYPYDVSVVVFHKRVLGLGYDGALEAERLVNARVVTTGTSGGELLLESRGEDGETQSPFEELRTGQYVMLCGPDPQSTVNNPKLVLQWYRVLTIEDEGSPKLDGSSDTYTLDRDIRVLVSLRGPDWPWLPASETGGVLGDTDLLSNDLRVAIIPGAVAVHTKTMRLESGSAWSVE